MHNPPIIARAAQHGARTALIDATGPHTYSELLNAAHRIAAALLRGRSDLEEARVAFSTAPGFAWVATQWGIWLAGGIAVPLPQSAATPELEYLIDDSDASTFIFDSAAAPFAEHIALTRLTRVLAFDSLLATPPAALPAIDPARRAMLLYTSGTTSKPKGVVTTHANITAQINTLISAWEWTSDDSILLVLPLHHVHGIINVLSCALYAGATCYTLPRFDPEAAWQHIASGHLTLFMAVPTIYIRLIDAWDAATPARQKELTTAAAKLRLMVSGSAALPVTTLHRWQAITHHTLLERYGMTEIGMALSNPLHGERIPGSVGTPLPSVEVQLTAEDGSPTPPNTPGEIEVRGPSVFLEYWRRPEATRDAFRNGWFRTGDTAVLENHRYRILGRTSIDILKSGGHKLSALEIEEVLRTHPAIAECAVVGLPDAEWGERVAAALVLHPTHTLTLEALRAWAREHLAAHKLPSRLLILETLPRNAMGKVVKPTVATLFKEDHAN